MKIQDVEIKTGLDRATIRFYEKENILTPERAENGYRNYSDADVELLLKIKLLRKLGVNLPTIKALQQGRENLTEVLTQQIQILEQQIQNDTRAKAVCIQMQNDGAQYLTLDSELYLQELNVTREKSSFQENFRKEIHPVRRFLARDMDFLLIGALMNVLLIMIFRIRPCSAVFMICIKIISYAAVLPLEAMMLHLWGTTPGKWLMGMRLEDPNGGKLSFGAGFIRTWHVTFAGLGLYIPLYSQWRLWKSYTAVSAGEGAYWDDEAEIQYSDPKALKIISAVALSVAALLLNYAASQDAILPTYRPENLTMKKFVANYRDYEKLFENDNTMILGEDGKWTERINTDVEIFQIGDGTHERKNFQYTYNEKGGIQTISFSDHWEDIQFTSALPDYCRTALYTAVGSRPGARTKDLQQVDELIETQFGETMQTGGVHSGSFQISDVQFAWEAELPAGEYMYVDGMLWDLADVEKTIPYSLDFIITIR